jgi:hypothetical protein
MPFIALTVDGNTTLFNNRYIIKVNKLSDVQGTRVLYNRGNDCIGTRVEETVFEVLKKIKESEEVL